MTTQIEKIVETAKARIGSTLYNQNGMTYCQRFVRQCYETAGLKGAASSAAEARRKWMQSSSKNNIPLGAAVYFKGSKPQYGHVGIYIGSGQVVHVGKKCVVKTGLSGGGKYLGWGWQGGKKPEGAFFSSNVSADSSDGGYTTAKAEFTAYYPANNSMEGGFLDCKGNKLDPSKHTCAAPPDLAYGQKIKVLGTDTKIDNVIYTVTDRGGAIKKNSDGTYRIDILMSTKAECDNFGRRTGKILIYNGDPEGGADSDYGTAENKEITSVAVKEAYGAAGTYRFTGLKKIGNQLQSGAEILIQNDKIYMPTLCDEITLDRERFGSPGVLKFSVLKDDKLDFAEGNPVSFRYNGKNVFYGYIFKKSRSDSRKIEVTAYDQIRYLKNKDSFVYENQTAASLLKMICDKYGLKWGDVEDSKYVIPGKVAEDTLLDIIDSAIEETALNANELYVMFDDYGNLGFKNFKNMAVPILICADTASAYSCESSIDDKTYSRVKVAVDNEETGEREIYMAQDKAAMENFGILQYYENVNGITPEVAIERAKVQLEEYKKKTRKLSVSGCFGDIRVRGGSCLYVALNLGDIDLSSIMLVEKVRHKFDDGIHTMDLTLRGGTKDGDFVV